MFFTSDIWLGIGIVAIIGFVVVGFATGMGKLIILLFGAGHRSQNYPGGIRAR